MENLKGRDYSEDMGVES